MRPCLAAILAVLFLASCTPLAGAVELHADMGQHNVASSVSLDLVPGFNLISLPVNDSSITTAASLAAKLGPNCTEVVKFNSAQQQLQSYVPGVPLNNFAIVGGEGYFVNLNNPTTVLFSGNGWLSPFHMSLVKDLNLIGVPVNDAAITTASTLAAKIGTNCQEVVNWESGMQAYVSYVPGVPLNNFAIRSGEGYFVTMADQADVIFGSAASVTRDLPDAVSPGETFNVSLTQSGFLLDAGIVTETLPAGFTYVLGSLPSDTAEYEPATNNLTLYFKGVTKLTYHVEAGTAEQIEDAVFSGVWKTLDMQLNKLSGDVAGETRIQ